MEYSARRTNETAVFQARMMTIHAGSGLLHLGVNAAHGLDNSDYLTADLSAVAGHKGRRER